MKKFLLFVSLIISNFAIHAQYGLLDPTFGSGGKVTLNTSSGFDNAAKIFILENSKILVIGTGTEGLSKFFIARYLTDGTLDNEFGTDGYILTQIGSANTYGVSGAIQEDGKIIVAGNSDEAGQNVFAVARYNANGLPDESFGDNGIFITALADGAKTLTDIAVQPDGKLVICGYTGPGTNDDFVLLRLNNNGSVDETFGNNGEVVYDISGGIDEAKAVLVQSNGKILVAGYSADDTRILIATLVEYNADGSLNNDFGTNGLILSTPGPSASEFTDIATLPDGKIVATGGLDYDGQYDFLVARFMPDGTPDSDFADNGFFSMDDENTSNHASSLIIQPDHKIIISGQHGIWPTSSFALLRLNDNGEPDNTFGDEGLTLTSFFGGYDYAVSSALQSNGKLIVGGTAGQGSDYMLGMARYTTGITVGTEEIFQETFSTKIFPNPIVNGAILSLTLESESKVSITLFDLAGKKIKAFSNNTRFTSGQHQLSLDLSNVNAGIYFLNVSEENYSQTIKLLKQ